MAKDYDLPKDNQDLYSKERFEKLKKWYSEEIERRDKIIDELQKENTLLLKSSLKTSKRLSEIQNIEPEAKIYENAMNKLKIKEKNDN